MQPVAPAPLPGLPITPVEFDGMSVTPYVHQATGRLAYSLRATAMRAPRTPSGAGKASANGKEAA